MSNPIKPNFNPNTGKLVTNRYDFQSHVDGTSFRHNANQINLFSTLVIGGNPTNNVQDSLSAITTIVNSLPPSPDATTSSKGFIQISGDITGIATNIKVVGLQSKPISNLAPTNNQVLTWDGVNGFWAPKTPTNFIAGGDLSGSNTNQQVTSLTGPGGGGIGTTMNAAFQTLQFNIVGASPVIQQPNNNAGNGLDFNFFAQNSTFINGAGGNINILGGAKNGSGKRGGIRLRMNGSVSETVLQLIEPVQNQRVLGLFSGSDVSAVNMPVNTGDMVMFVKDAATAPTSGVPTGGCIVYSSSGQLNIKQSDGTKITVGVLLNPNLIGSVRFTTNLLTAGIFTPLSYNVDSNPTADYLLLCDTTNETIAITLPAPTNGRTIIIKDAVGFANTNNIYIVPHFTEKIDGSSSTRQLTTNRQVFKLISDGIDWFII